MCCFHQQNFSFPATLTGTCRSVFPYKYRCNVSSDIVIKQKTADTLFSTASLGSVRTGIGLVASIPLRGIAGVFALSSAAMVGASKKKSNARFLNIKEMSLSLLQNTTKLNRWCNMRSKTRKSRTLSSILSSTNWTDIRLLKMLFVWFLRKSPAKKQTDPKT